MAKSKKNNKHIKLYGAILLIWIVSVKLFGGVYKDDEFGQKKFFIKHKPSWKFYFYSPRSMSNVTLEEMPENKRSMQIMYDEFVPKRRWEFPLSY